MCSVIKVFAFWLVNYLANDFSAIDIGYWPVDEVGFKLNEDTKNQISELQTLSSDTKIGSLV